MLSFRLKNKEREDVRVESAGYVRRRVKSSGGEKARRLDEASRKYPSRRTEPKPPDPDVPAPLNKRTKTGKEKKVRRQIIDKGDLPWCSRSVDSREDRSEYIGIVLPPGHGKTSMCNEEDWVDCDELVPRRGRNTAREASLELIAQGSSITDSFEPLLYHMKQTLEVYRPPKKTVFLASHPYVLSSLGIPCVGVGVLEPDILDGNLSSRDPAEQKVAKACLEDCIRQCPPDITVYRGSKNWDMRYYVYAILGYFDVSGGAPSLYGGDSSMLPEGLGGEAPVKLDHVTALAAAGKIRPQIAHYHVRKQGRPYYNGYGFTANNWASTMASAALAMGDTDEVPSWSRWPVNLSNLGQKWDISEHDDIRAILDAHRGEVDDQFLTTLILHWKSTGIHHDIEGRLFSLYKIRSRQWTSTMLQVRAGVMSSCSYQGFPITIEEREIILSMHLLNCGDRRKLQKRLKSGDCGAPTMIPNQRTLASSCQRLQSVDYKARPENSEAWADLKKYIGTGRWSTIELPGPQRRERRHYYAEAVGRRLANEWYGTPGWQQSVAMAMHKICSVWFRVSKIRDEWSDVVYQAMTDDIETDSEAYVIADMVACRYDDGIRGTDWSTRVAECLCLCIMVETIAERSGRTVSYRLDVRSLKVKPFISGLAPRQVAENLAFCYAPKYVIDRYGEGYCEGWMQAGEVHYWTTSSAMLVLELVSADTWLGKLHPKHEMALIANWLCRAGKNEVLNRVISSYYRRLTDHKLTKERADGVMTWAWLSVKDGGGGCMAEVYRGKAKGDVFKGQFSVTRDRREPIDRIAARDSLQSGVMLLQARWEDNSFSRKTLGSVALGIGGAATVSVLSAQDSNDLKQQVKAVFGARELDMEYGARTGGPSAWEEELRPRP